MKRLISERLAAIAMLCILSLVVLFHLLVVAGVVPTGIVWGGRMQTREELLKFEVVSITLNLIMLAVVAIRAGLFLPRINGSGIRIALWLMAVLFLFNTIGNLMAKDVIETLAFTPLTLILGLLSLRLALR